MCSLNGNSGDHIKSFKCDNTSRCEISHATTSGQGIPQDVYYKNKYSSTENIGYYEYYRGLHVLSDNNNLV